VLADEPAFADSGGSLVLLRMLGGFALMALLLAATGVFGVIGHSVAQRTREFGIRIALGSTPRGVLALVAAREAKLIVAALGIGAAATLALTRVLFPGLAALTTTAPPVWIALLGLCGGTVGLAGLLAACRIVRLEPSVVLRRT
jgi:ABC-type antimicrobial peptide transport system permease subunit